MDNIELTKIVPGFRSLTRWKMAIACVVYLFFLLIMFIGPGEFLLSLFFFLSMIVIGTLSQIIYIRKIKHKFPIYLAILLVFLITGTALASSIDPNFLRKNTPQSETDQLQDNESGLSVDKASSSTESEIENTEAIESDQPTVTPEQDNGNKKPTIYKKQPGGTENNGGTAGGGSGNGDGSSSGDGSGNGDGPGSGDGSNPPPDGGENP